VPVTVMSMGSRSRQLSLFGVEARPPTPFDLEGLLLGPGQVARMGGTARVSIEVDAAWRALVLRGECALRGLVSSASRVVPPAPDEDQGDPAVPVQEQKDLFFFGTAYSAVLAPLATRWLGPAPTRLVLDGRRLRLWAIAAGARDGTQSYLLRAGSAVEAAGAALAGAGLPAGLLESRADGPAYRIVGRRRLARLAELIGEPPRQAPPDEWPV
jgi:hypothetical protein